MSWTKIDLRRMQAVLDRFGESLRKIRPDATDPYRERVNASLRSEAREHVRVSLLRLADTLVDQRERKAAARIALRLVTEGLPESLVVPQLPLRRDIERNCTDWEREQIERFHSVGMHRSAEEIVWMANHRAEEQAAAQLQAALVEAAKPREVSAEDRLARDRRAVAFNLADLVKRGVVEVHRATSDAFNTDVVWTDVEGVVSWQAWARPVGDEQTNFVLDLWDRHTSTAEARANVPRHVFNSGPFWLVWSDACRRQPLPDVLDLRGAPESGGGLIESWREALSIALHESTRGIVILVDDHPDILARCLPSHTKAP
jgi:hypothetical protein